MLLAAPIHAAFTALNGWLMEQDRYLAAMSAAVLSIPEISTPTPLPPASPPTWHAPVQIRIPALGVTRSIIELPTVQNRRTGQWELDVKRLFRTGRNDLVGHWAGTASPGQPGNMILVGHNYGYGYQGVFVRLGRLKAGQEVEIVDDTGAASRYRVVTVERVPWRAKDADELHRHWDFLSLDGPERLTLVSCAGSSAAPFPERVYVVAEPAP